MKLMRTLLLAQIAGALALSAAVAADAKKKEPTDPIKFADGLTAMPGVRIHNLEIFTLVGPEQNSERDYMTASHHPARETGEPVATCTPLVRLKGGCFALKASGSEMVVAAERVARKRPPTNAER